MSEKDFTFATEVAPLSHKRKLFGGSVATQVARDLEDFDQVFDLAEEIAAAGDRRVMALTLAETRAIANLAITAAVIASHAAELFVLSDANAPREEIIAKLTVLADLARPHIRRNP